MTDAYRNHIAWEKVTWASHCGNCIANCAYRLYTRDGKVLWEEPSGDIPGNAGVPDMNPLGCQKGAAWMMQIDGGDRIRYPMRRVGERGSGQWEQISWDEALDEVADAIIDALQEQGPHSIVIDEGAEGGVLTGMGKARLATALDAVSIDGNSSVSDVHLGHWATFGNLLAGSAADDTFRSDVIIIWNANPAFTRIPYFHFLPEARYRGAKVVIIAPDYSPSAMHTDYFVPVVPGTDAALALGLASVILDEGLADWGFVASQTDLPLLVRTDTGRFLRAADIEEGGRDDRFFVWGRGGIGLRPAPMDRLDPPDEDPLVELEGRFEVTLADGSTVEVTPVLETVRERLAGYSPEKASEICGVHPDMIRELARLIAPGPTKLYNGLGSCKHYHGDLMERAMDLVLALTGSWGRPGTGMDTYIIAMMEGEAIGLLKRSAGAKGGEGAITAMDTFLDAFLASDPELTEGGAVLKMMRTGAPLAVTTPPAFYLYYHCGFDEIWQREGYGDSPRPIDEYIEEAQSKGWWGGLVKPERDISPRVIIQAGTNTLRRTRGGQRTMLKHLWPKLSMVAVIDWRMNTAGMNADILLPTAAEAEQVNLHGVNSHSWERMFSDKAVEPRGDSRTDWQIFQGLAGAIERRAAARSLETYPDGRGGAKRYDEIVKHCTMGGAIEDDEAALDELIRDSVLAGNIPAGTSISTLREKGWVRPVKLPRAMRGVHCSELVPGEVFVSYRDHVEKGVPFETLTGRAQFYIDHPWFLEAGEQLPCHKPVPKIGGDFPLQLTGGHPRWSIHATNTTNQVILETTRGGPTVHLNPADAETRGIADGDLVRLFNEMGDCRTPARISPAVRPGQVILYASWEQYLFPEWKDVTYVEPGVVKWLHFAGGYGHLGYSALQWQPAQSDRLYRVEAERADG